MHQRCATSLLLALAAACTLQAPLAHAQGLEVPAGGQVTVTVQPSAGDAHAAAFDRADRRARTVVTKMRCAQRAAALRMRGAFGPADSLGRSGNCIAVGGRWIAVFHATDSAVTRIERIAAVDVGTGARHTAPLDTAALLAVARANHMAQERGVDAYISAERPFAPLAIRFDGDSIEVWLIPGAVFSGPPLTVGGERGYVFSSDGRTIAREVDAFGEMRTFALPDTGTVTIPSPGADIPGMTVMLLANLLAESGRQVAIDSPRGTALLVGEGASAVWMHLRRGGPDGG